MEHLKPFLNTWRQIKTENLDAFLEAKGTPWILRKIMVNTGLDEKIELMEKKIVISYTTIGTRIEFEPFS